MTLEQVKKVGRFAFFAPVPRPDPDDDHWTPMLYVDGRVIILKRDGDSIVDVEPGDTYGWHHLYDCQCGFCDVESGEADREWRRGYWHGVGEFFGRLLESTVVFGAADVSQMKPISQL